VLPTTATATINCRILPGETRAQVRDALVKVIGDPGVEVALGPDFGDGPVTPFEGEVVLAVNKVAAATFPGMPIVPAMSSGASDSRHLRRIGIRAYGVSPGMSTRAESKAAHGAHGPDERKSVKWMGRGAEYFRAIVRALVVSE
jgi:acetylornithine deacetylase/succinyl-diaminopimelate desuccinylase-like protein